MGFNESAIIEKKFKFIMYKTFLNAYFLFLMFKYIVVLQKTKDTLTFNMQKLFQGVKFLNSKQFDVKGEYQKHHI